MKNLIKFLGILTLVLSVSCTDEIENREAVSTSFKPVLKTPTTLSLVLKKENASDFATAFAWDIATYNGTNTPVNYSLEFAKAGTNFKDAVVVSTTKNKYINFKVEELNQAVLDAGFLPSIIHNIDVRIRANVGENCPTCLPQYSNHFTLTLTAYPSWPNWGIIGSATPTGWGADTDMSYNLQTKIHFIEMQLTGGQEIKFRLDDSWGTNFGGAGGVLVSSGANIPISVTGNYLVKCNFNEAAYDGMPAKTYTITLL
jgi:hypothetical protein